MKTKRGFIGVGGIIAFIIAVIAAGGYVVWKNGQSDGPYPVSKIDFTPPATTPNGDSPSQVVKKFFDRGGDYKEVPLVFERNQGGLEVNPAWCAQDVPDVSREYKLVSQSDDKATVEANHVYSGSGEHKFKINLEFKNEAWEVTDIVCD